MTRLPRTLVPYLVVALVVAAAGGGYAVAASNTKTITVCADKKSGVLYLKTRGRCRRSQTRVSWNQQGPRGLQGPQGPQGPTGPQGAAGPQGAPGTQGPAGVTVWAYVAGNGTIAHGHGIAVQHVSAGTYQVTITDPTCAPGANAPVVSVSDAAPGLVQGGVFPTAWYGATVFNQQFTVYTGVVSAGPPMSFTASDHTFDVLDACS